MPIERPIVRPNVEALFDELSVGSCVPVVDFMVLALVVETSGTGEDGIADER